MSARSPCAIQYYTAFAIYLEVKYVFISQYSHLSFAIHNRVNILPGHIGQLCTSGGILPTSSDILLPEVFKKAPGDKDSIFSSACFVNALFSSTKAYRTLYFLDKKGDRDREAIWILLVQVGDTLYNDGQSTRQKNGFDIYHLRVNSGRILDHLRKHSSEAYARIMEKE